MAAVRGAFKNMPVPEAIGYTLGGMRGALKAWFTKPDVELREERLATCYECQLYDTELKTCGTPGHMRKDDPEDTEGCWCFLPLVAGLKEKRCYLRTHDHPYGWRR